MTRGFAAWNRDQTPSVWLLNSVVWVPQDLTPRLGRSALQRYLTAFGYGDADVSGDLASFWLTSEGTTSLKVSADDQVAFLRRLAADELPVKPSVQAHVRAILPHKTGAHGEVLAGKTGSGFLRRSDGTVDRHRRLGWFVGLLTIGNRRYVLACNMQDRSPDVTQGYAGSVARRLCERISHDRGLFLATAPSNSGTTSLMSSLTMQKALWAE